MTLKILVSSTRGKRRIWRRIGGFYVPENETENSPFPENIDKSLSFSPNNGHKKAGRRVPIRQKYKKMVARTRIELVTQGFSVPCSTN